MNGRGAAKIVIVDDSMEITRLLQNILTREGYQVVITNEASAASRVVRQEHPDLIVLDICMPEIDGWEVCRQIRAEFSTPILMLTVLGEPHHVDRVFQSGANAYMSKPFSIHAFLERVSILLRSGVHRLDGSGQKNPA